MTEETPTPRDITQDKRALFELLYLTRSWLEKHGYLPMHAKFALLWVYGVLECVGDERLNTITTALATQVQTLQHRVEALEEALEERLELVAYPDRRARSVCGAPTARPGPGGRPMMRVPWPYARLAQYWGLSCPQARQLWQALAHTRAPVAVRWHAALWDCEGRPGVPLPTLLGSWTPREVLAVLDALRGTRALSRETCGPVAEALWPRWTATGAGWAWPAGPGGEPRPGGRDRAVLALTTRYQSVFFIEVVYDKSTTRRKRYGHRTP